ncbi:ABC-2 type transport system ATP-binding protein [Melghirimyces profundicolus]|uniref:ABC-2 type transport system ATP-binding protein n=1 Tax=Melghirimyces profundicolus TaxID=1242148 RepID=A0A2T6C9P0_9BACL|nr:ABC transporter ATP-binding protein [Melghirimyces profundicolus]PTX64993.1 ABC-2 type transport system ATP-binding protein [Melghirimyces profundicolus]
MIRMKQVTKRYGNQTALDGIDLTLGESGIHGLVGPDGAGKTTLMKLAAGLLKPTRGKVVREQGTSLGYVPQSFGMYEEMSVAENLHFYGRLNGLPRRERQERMEELLRWTDLAPFADRAAGSLSGGMKQKLAIAAAVLHRPHLLLLDEPTNGVDPLSRREVWELICSVMRQGTRVFVSTQYLEEARHCDRVILLFRGRLLADREPGAYREDFPYPVWVVRDASSVRMKWLPRLREEPAVAQAYSRGTDLVVWSRDADKVRQLLEGLSREEQAGKVEAEAPGWEDVFSRYMMENGKEETAW